MKAYIPTSVWNLYPTLKRGSLKTATWLAVIQSRLNGILAELLIKCAPDMPPVPTKLFLLITVEFHLKPGSWCYKMCWKQTKFSFIQTLNSYLVTALEFIIGNTIKLFKIAKFVTWRFWTVWSFWKGTVANTRRMANIFFLIAIPSK